jgi:hypothetical protein
MLKGNYEVSSDRTNDMVTTVAVGQENKCHVHNMQIGGGNSYPFGSISFSTHSMPLPTNSQSGERCEDRGSMCVKSHDVKNLELDVAGILRHTDGGIPTIGDEFHDNLNDTKSIPGATKEADMSGSVVATEKEINHFIRHRINKNNHTVSIEVSFQDGSSDWSEEQSLHDKVPHLLTKYWDSHGGRDSATGLDKYRVHKVLGQRTIKRKSISKRKGTNKRKNNNKRKNANKIKSTNEGEIEYWVEWIGFPAREEYTWEGAEKIRDIARDPLKQYYSRLGKRP